MVTDPFKRVQHKTPPLTLRRCQHLRRRLASPFARGGQFRTVALDSQGVRLTKSSPQSGKQRVSPNLEPTTAMMPLELFLQIEPKSDQLRVVRVEPSTTGLGNRFQAEIFGELAAGAISPADAPRHGAAGKPRQTLPDTPVGISFVVEDDEDKLVDFYQAAGHRAFRQETQRTERPWVVGLLTPPRHLAAPSVNTRWTHTRNHLRYSNIEGAFFDVRESDCSHPAPFPCQINWATGGIGCGYSRVKRHADAGMTMLRETLRIELAVESCQEDKAHHDAHDRRRAAVERCDDSSRNHQNGKTNQAVGKFVHAPSSC